MTAVYPSLTALANQEFLATHDTGCTTEVCTPLCHQASQFAQLPTGMIDTDRITAAYTAAHAPVGDPEEGASTAEYGIVMLAAVGFAGLLVAILKSDEVREMLLGVIRNALSIG